MKPISIQEVFTQYCKERHTEDKGKNFNLLQSVFSNTELFDVSMLDVPQVEYIRIVKAEYGNALEVNTDRFKDITLPFLNNFVKFKEGGYLFIREFEPTIITGAFYISGEKYNKNIKNMYACYPFSISTETGKLYTQVLEDINSAEYKNHQDFYNNVVKLCYSCAIKGILPICNLPKHSVVADTPKNQTVYYPMKKAQGIKVVNRPIYYVLEKKNAEKKIKGIRTVGNLEYTHAFKVRGHYMKINPKSMGKDRNGNRSEKMLGITWRTSYIKGSGELVKKVRICK